MDETCTICMDLPAAGTTVRTLACTHKFCANCLQEWWATAPANSCPTCRKCFAGLRSSTVSIAEPAPQQQTGITESAVGAGLVAANLVEQEVRSAEVAGNEGAEPPDSLAAEVERRGLLRRDNSFSSRHKGVSWDKATQKWQARISHGGKTERLGYFTTEDEAKARHDARSLELGINADAGLSSGFRGVYWAKTKRKWKASISIDGKDKHLGLFEATARGEVDAALAYDAAAHTAGRPGKANFETAWSGTDSRPGDLLSSGDLDTMKACADCNSSGAQRT
jgi:hypothetical protein